MRYPTAAKLSRGHPFFHVSRHALGATTVLMTSAVSAYGALAQTISAGEGFDGDKEEIIVKGTRSVVNEKLGGSVRDTPQSINIVTAKTLQEQAVTNLQDALRNVPGITLNAGEGTARGDTVNLRGFPAFNDFFLDGIRDAGNYTRDSFDLETLEVLKGPSAILFGRGSTGGVINQVTKNPVLSQFENAGLQFGTNNQIRATADINMPLTDSASIRVNGMAERSEVTDRDFVFNRRIGFAPSLALGIGEANSLTVSYLFQQENDRPDVGIPFLFGAPAPVSRNVDYGLTSDYFKASDNIATVKFRHAFNDEISVTNTARWSTEQFNNHASSPNFGNQILTPGQALSTIKVGRDDPASAGTLTNLTDQTDIRAHFETGTVTHDLTVGGELGRENNNLDRFNNPFNSNNNWIPETPLLNPNPQQSLPIVEPITSLARTKADVEAAYFTDTIHIFDTLAVTGGLRYDRFVSSFNSYNLNTKVTSNLARTDNVLSPRAAIVYKPTDNQSYYFSYGTSFDPSAEALALTAGTASLGPVKARTYELGSKVDFLNGALSATGALFRTEVSNAQISDPARPGIVVLAGNQRVDGLELGVSGHITEDWEILAGYTYLDPRTVGSKTPANVGKLLINATHNAFNLWTEYELGDWEIGTGVNYLGERYGDLANTARIPEYYIWNAMVGYKLNENYSFQMNVTNLTDAYYYANAYYSSPAENHVVIGSGRTFTFSAKAHF